MADTGWVFPTAESTGTPSGGTNTWSFSLGTIFSENSVGAAPTSADYGTTEYLRGYTFNFDIPAGATIDGIEAKHKTKADPLFGTDHIIREEKFELTNGGSVIGTNKGTNTILNNASYVVYTRGGTTDTWGTTLTPSIINSSTFGIVLRLTGTGFVLSTHTTFAEVDYMQLKIYYTEFIPTLSII